MTLKKFLNIKRSLIAILIISFLPIFLFSIVNSIKEAKRIFLEKEKSYLLEVEDIGQSENSIYAIYGILKTLSLDPSVKKFDKNEVEKQLKEILSQTKFFHNILIADINGNLLFSTINVGKIKPASDRLYFKRALSEKRFVWGEFAISRSTGKPVVHFALPVLDDREEVLSVIIAVPVMENLFREVKNKDINYRILDENGKIVKGLDDNEVGRPYEHFKEILKGEKKSDIISVKEHDIAYSKVTVEGKTFCYIVSDIPFTKFEILIQTGFFYQLFLVLLIFSICLYLSRIVGKKLIITPLDRLEEHIQKHKNEGILQKIDFELTGELDDFKNAYNSFVETINNKNRELEEQKSYWLNIFNSFPDPVFIVNPEYRIINANSAFLQIFNIDKEKLSQIHCYELLHHTEIPANFCPHNDVLNKGIAYTYELYIENLGKWFYVTYAPLSFQGKNVGTMHVLKDITKIKNAEEEKLKIERQLLHTQKLESLGILAGGIAHDFNNILMGILGNTELALLEREKLPSGVIQNLETIKKVTEKAAHLTRQMLAYSGKGKFVIKEINLNEMIREIFDLIKVSISKKAVVTLNLDEREPLIINGDPGQIEQVIMNLVINASEALEEKEGLITISTGKQFCDKKYFESTVNGHLTNLPDGEYVYFEVSDTGCGMDKETMNKIFEPFFTTKFTGRGLGLSAILGIVRGHNGAIRVYSEKGKGSSFKIIFPAVKASIKIDESKNFITSALTNKTVLIIDDEEVVREVSKKMIEFAGGKTIIAKDGREGLELFRENSHKIDFVLLDLTMPGLSGDEVFRELKKIKENVSVVLMSGYNEQEISQKLVGRGFAGFIQKPFTLEKLLDVFKNFTSPQNKN